MADSSKHLIYLLPDVAYVVELIQGKDEYTFSVKDYLQINGNFINDKELLGESIKKLVAKIQPKEYDLVLPDFLFTNTIINVEETSETKVKEHLETKIIPDLKISDKTHNIQHFVLTKLKDVSRVQLSALEYSVLTPFKDAFGKKNEASIKKVYPLSWTIKSLISLEPSISLVQMGTKLYLAQQYIGVDQANYSEVENATKLVETIKTLKGAEPSIQSLYLLSNELVEKNLKDGLSDTLPIQQLAKPDEDSEMPSYVKQVIEAGAKTMAVPDFKLPEFLLDAKPAGGAKVVASEDKAEEKSEEKSEDTKDKKEEDIKTETEKEKMPEEKPAEVEVKSSILPTPTEIGADDEKEETKEGAEIESKVEDKPEGKAEDKPDDKTSEKETPKPVAETDTLADTATSPSDVSTGTSLSQAAKVEEPTLMSDKPTDDAAIDLSQFSAGGSESTDSEESKGDDEDKAEDESAKTDDADSEDKKKDESESKDEDKKEVIKNKSGVNSMVKMIFVGLVSFFVTVGVGLGLGLGFLNFTNKTPEAPTEEVMSETSHAEEPTVAPTKAPEIDRTTYSVLIVNATTKAGYAGIVKSDLEDAGFEGIDAKNAKGEYDDGYYVLLDEENETLLKLLEEDMGFSLEFSDEKIVEDPNEEYDLVIVLSATE